MKSPSSDHRRTAKLRLIELHYDNLKEELTWTVDRYYRLCAALQLTVYELGALLLLRPCDVDRHLRSRNFPGPVRLHLTLIERTIYPSTKPPVLPPL